jgi:hypothetical protein
VHGLVNQVHGSQLMSPLRALNVNCWPSDQATDGRSTSSTGRWRRWKQRPGDAMAETWGSSASWYRAQKAMRFLPTCSRSWGELFLHTYSEGNRWREADDGKAARAFCNGDVSDFQRCSGLGNCSGGGSVGRGSFSKRWINVRCFSKTDWWRWLARGAAAWFRAKFPRNKALFIGIPR